MSMVLIIAKTVLFAAACFAAVLGGAAFLSAPQLEARAAACDAAPVEVCLVTIF